MFNAVHLNEPLHTDVNIVKPMLWDFIHLSPDEERIFEYRLFQFQGLQIAMNQFLNTNSFEYNEEHYSRLTGTYAEKRRLLIDQF